MVRSLWLATPILLLLTACSTNSGVQAQVSSSNHTSTPSNSVSLNSTTTSEHPVNSTTTNSSEPVAQSSQNNWTDHVYITAQTVKTPALSVTFPQIHGLQNRTVQANLNAMLKQRALPTSSSGNTAPNSYTWSSSYNVVFQQGDIINFLLSSYFYSKGAAHGMPGRQSLIANLKTGQIYSMKDFFKSNSNYLNAVSQVVKNEDHLHALDTFQKFTGVTNKDTVYLAPKGFVVDFVPYEWASFAQGFLDYPVTFESVAGVIDKRGLFWTALQDKDGFPATDNQANETRKIKSLGYTPASEPEYHTQVFLGQGRYMQAWVASRNGSSNTEPYKVFFFLNGQYLGTDTEKAHGYVDSLAPDGPDTIAITYGEPTTSGSDAQFTIHYQWKNDKLVLHGAFPENYTWYA